MFEWSGLSLILVMAAKTTHGNRPEYRSLQSPKIVAIWPKQRPPSRVAGEFMIAARFGVAGMTEVVLTG